MKFHETHFEEYVASVEKHNIHPELAHLRDTLPPSLANFGNIIVHGPAGVGKYSFVLWLLKKYSASELKYDKRMTIQTEKQQYMYRISDIHYEIDMELLGCNSKILWHEIFGQIVEIVSMKPEKKGIIVCKNFACIHNELLEIFYSYMQQYNHPHLTIQIYFILLTEHVSFLPNTMINSSRVIHVGRPKEDMYTYIMNKPTTSDTVQPESAVSLPNNVDPAGILNIKEVYSFGLIKPDARPPQEFFVIICDAIIQELMSPEKIVITSFRDTIYDILVYNLDVADCIWYIVTHFIELGKLQDSDISDILQNLHPMLKHYNNNYRPIYHLENIFFYMLNKIHRLS
jgi:hypothetical protein